MSGPEGGVARTETRVWQPGPLARLAQAVAHCGRSWRARASNGQPGSGSGPGSVPAARRGMAPPAPVWPESAWLPPRSPPDQCNKLICAQAPSGWPAQAGMAWCGGRERLVSVVTLAQRISAAGILFKSTPRCSGYPNIPCNNRLESQDKVKTLHLSWAR